MGWLFMYDCRTKQDLVDHLVNNFEFTDTAVRGNVLYGVTATVRNVTDNFGDIVQIPDGGRVIIICLLSCDRSNRNYPMWGYKDMDEGMYPYYFTCPERILAQSTVPDERGWRAACREARKVVSRFKEGQWYEFSTPLDGETRWQYQRHRRWASRDQLYWRSEKGREYRIPNVGKRFKPVAV